MLLLKLFFSFIQVGLFSVGGGYACNSAYSGTNSKHTPPYDYGGIFRPYHCCGNDPGS